MDEHYMEQSFAYEAILDTMAAAETLPPSKKKLPQEQEDDMTNGDEQQGSIGLDRMRRTIEEWIKNMNSDDERVFLGDDLASVLENRQTEFSAFRDIYTSLRSLMDGEGEDGESDDNDTVGTTETDEELQDGNDLDSDDEEDQSTIADNSVVKSDVSLRQVRIDKRYEPYIPAKDKHKERPRDIKVWHIQVEKKGEFFRFELSEANNNVRMQLDKDDVLAQVQAILEATKSDIRFKIIKDSAKYDIDHCHIVGHLKEMISHNVTAATQVAEEDSNTRWRDRVRTFWKPQQPKSSFLQPIKAIKDRTASWKARMVS